MKRRELAMMSIGALRRKKRSLKIVLGILIGLLLIMIVVAILVAIQKGFALLTLTPLVFFIVVLNTKKNLDTVRMELLGRDELLSPYTNQPRS
jgi:flagellar basal body-associated protein FliL